MSHRPLPSLPSGHLRRRSITDSESVELLTAPASGRQSFSALRPTPSLDPDASSSALARDPSSTVIEFDQVGARSAEYYALHDDKPELRGDEGEGEGDGHGGGAGAGAWRNKRQPARPAGGRAFPKKGLGIALGLVGVGVVLGWVGRGWYEGRGEGEALALVDGDAVATDSRAGRKGASPTAGVQAFTDEVLAEPDEATSAPVDSSETMGELVDWDDTA